MHGLTKRQEQTLSFIRRSIEERGYPPTLREIGEHMGIKSTNGVNDHLRALERKGYLRRRSTEGRTSRALTLAVPRHCLDEGLFVRVIVRTQDAQLRQLTRERREALVLLRRSLVPGEEEVALVDLIGDLDWQY